MSFHDIRRRMESIERCLDGEFTEELLEDLLKVMGYMFEMSDRYRRNIEGFSGNYVFKGADGSFAVSASFRDGKMMVSEGQIADPNLKISFKNPHALLNFIFSPKPDVLNAMLTQEVTLDGNLNFLYKFAYMANHLRLKGLQLLI